MLPAFNRFLLSPEEAAAVANREREEGGGGGGGGGAGGGANEQVGCGYTIYYGKFANVGITQPRVIHTF